MAIPSLGNQTPTWSSSQHNNHSTSVKYEETTTRGVIQAVLQIRYPMAKHKTGVTPVH